MKNKQAQQNFELQLPYFLLVELSSTDLQDSCTVVNCIYNLLFILLTCTK